MRLNYESSVCAEAADAQRTRGIIVLETLAVVL